MARIPDTWFISDTHFWHSNLIKFENGRREFSSVEEMNELIIERWRECVKPSDIVWHLGDVTFRYDGAFNEIMSRLPGHKRLLVGNHDKLGNPNLMRWFERTELWTGKRFLRYGFFATHIPLPLSEFRHGEVLCVHGHKHRALVRDERGEPHRSYMSVCVEQTDYRPVHIETITQRARELCA